ncbi:rhomboid family intramembrane serine protease [uncultured Chitinophaga sp.]|uniref:rhomboid family intramembrane serine protease n=1 Tax=uncultured Chitinophaga sp. TaxID=339340 RepID=UPI0025F9C728|nr:rhomboid family intramembrane serine protease [uncultured Chitinophaga sp.]
MSISLSIIILTCLVTITAFRSEDQKTKLSMWPYGVKHYKQLYRLLTSGLVHADYPHLIFNMLSLYFFSVVEDMYVVTFGSKYYFLLMYVLALVVSDIPSLIKHRDHEYYYSLGASGAVSAVIFSGVLFQPWAVIYFYFIKMPAIVYGVIFLLLSIYLDRRGQGNVAHDAHYWGACFGLLFPVLLDPSIGYAFINTLQHGFPGLKYYYGGGR